jgi:hypothetical protein
MPTLRISSEKVCNLVVMARAFDVQDVGVDSDSGSNPADDGMIDVLEEHGDNPVVEEVVGFVEQLDDDEKADLIALMQLGRGDGTFEDWAALRDQGFREHGDRVASYLLGQPQVSDFLEEALSQFGFSCAKFEIGRL